MYFNLHTLYTTPDLGSVIELRQTLLTEKRSSKRKSNSILQAPISLGRKSPLRMSSLLCMLIPGGAAIIAPRERQKAQAATAVPLRHGEEGSRFSHSRFGDGRSLTARCVQALSIPCQPVNSRQKDFDSCIISLHGKHFCTPPL